MLGVPFWSLRFADILREGGGGEIEADFVPIRDLARSRGLRAVMAADILLRMGYRPGARTWRGRVFDGLWAFLRAVNPRAKAVHYWIGTDVLHTLQDHRSGRLRPGPLRRAQRDLHWADAPWLVDELAEVGLDARYIALPVPLLDVQPPDRLPAPFTVLTYIPDHRAEFYDGPTILQAARALPGIRFEVIGGEGTWARSPLPNLAFFGWQKDVRPFLARASVVVRLVRHDGMGGTVLEALQAGRHVIYSQSIPCVTVVSYQDPTALEAALRELQERFEAGGLAPNLAGHRYVREVFDLQQRCDAYLSDLRRHLSSTALIEDTKP